MKKLSEFAKTIPTKLYLLLAALLAFAFFSNDFGLVDIQKTAVILAAGVDKAEEGFSVTAQIAVPKGSDRTTGGTSSVEIEGKGKTVSDCISQIYTETGWVPKLVFCDLIVLGEELADGDVFSALDYFLRNEYMPDSALVAVYEGKAGDLLSSTSAIDDASSLAIEKLFSDAAEKSGHVSKNTLKNFAIGYYGASKSGYMPYVSSVEQEGGESGAESGGEQNGSASAGGEESEKIYRAEQTALFYEGKMVSLLNENETFAYNLLNGKVFSGTFTVEENGKPRSLTILKNSGGVSLDMKGAPSAKFTVDLKIRLHNSGVPAPIEDVTESKPSEEAEKIAEQFIRSNIQTLWKKCAESGCDLFMLNRSLYRSSVKKYEEWNSTLLSAIRPEIVAHVRGID